VRAHLTQSGHAPDKQAGAQCGTGELSGDSLAWARQAIVSYITTLITLACDVICGWIYTTARLAQFGKPPIKRQGPSMGQVNFMARVTHGPARLFSLM
jgi:hypothetical protein